MSPIEVWTSSGEYGLNDQPLLANGQISYFIPNGGSIGHPTMEWHRGHHSLCAAQEYPVGNGVGLDAARFSVCGVDHAIGHQSVTANGEGHIDFGKSRPDTARI